MGSPEVITMGRVGVDLYPEQIGVSLAEVRTFAKSLGGSPTNVAVGAARLGRRAAVITKVGRDGFGDYVRAALAGFGVDARWVGTDPDLRTPIVFCEIYPPDRFPILFYREPKAPDMNITRDELDLDAIAKAPVFWTTGTGLSEEPSRTATLAALDARSGREVTIHDLDHRHHLWTSGEEARRYAREALRRATVVVGNTDEVEMATGLRDPRAAAAALLEMGPRLAVVKRGGEGAYARTSRDEVSVPAVETRVLNGLGAGDAFGGALCHGLLAGWPLARTLEVANAAGAIVASRLACADAMPTLAEIESLLAGRVAT
jgi:5-dehydro-2-deoxygluconokinase